MRSSSTSIIIVAVFLVYQICLNAGDGSGNCKFISTNTAYMIRNITLEYYDDNEINDTCIDVDNGSNKSNCAFFNDCDFTLCVLLLNDNNYCTTTNDSCILLSNGSNCTINLPSTTTSTFTNIALPSSTIPPFTSSLLISSSPVTTSTPTVSTTVVRSPSASSSPSATPFQLSDLIEEPYIYYWLPGLALLMLMCCACIICLTLCTWIRSWKSKMHAYKFVIGKK